MVDEYQAVWSEKILDEWLCSSSKQGYISQESAKIEIMQVNLRFPNSMQPLKNFETEEYWLPDFNDIHVLALAIQTCLLYTSPSPRDMRRSRMPSSA